MDPQQRWLLEASYRAFENGKCLNSEWVPSICDLHPLLAGIPIENVAGTNTAVISGSMSNDYMNMLSKDPDNSPDHTATGTTNSILANRLSWYFDLKGPSIQVDTACSSSMIAMDLACKSLQTPQTSMVSHL
jgi:acyl transferase domain-containing protein